MSDDPLDDLELQAFEARLAVSAPAPPLARQQQLLYECAFAAGSRAGRRKLQFWQSLATVFAFLFFGAMLPTARNRALLADGEHEPARREAEWQAAKQKEPSPSFSVGAGASVVSLDAWQTAPSANAFDEELAQFEQLEPQWRAVALGPLTRKLLEP